MQNCRSICPMLHEFLSNFCWTHLHTNEGKKRRSSPKNCVSRLCNRRQMRHQSIISEPSHDHFAESLMVFLFSKSFPNRQVGNKACCTTTTTANDNIQWSSILCMHRHKHTLDLFLSLFGFFLFHLWCVHALYEHM